MAWFSWSGILWWWYLLPSTSEYFPAYFSSLFIIRNTVHIFCEIFLYPNTTNQTLSYKNRSIEYAWTLQYIVQPYNTKLYNKRYLFLPNSLPQKKRLLFSESSKHFNVLLLCLKIFCPSQWTKKVLHVIWKSFLKTFFIIDHSLFCQLGRIFWAISTQRSVRATFEEWAERNWLCSDFYFSQVSSTGFPFVTFLFPNNHIFCLVPFLPETPEYFKIHYSVIS